MPGVDLFTGSKDTLQSVLLPWLSAADLLRLSTTCKAVETWILSTPPRLWLVRFQGWMHLC